MESISKLFKSEALVKLLRFFILNPDIIIDAEDVAKKVKANKKEVKKEINLLLAIKFIKKKSFSKEVLYKNRKKPVRKKTIGYFLNQDFVGLSKLRSIFASTVPLTNEQVTRRLRPTGTIKLLVLSGVFAGRDDGSVDILIVGDSFKTRTLESALSSLEAELGRELVYATMETEEFLYRNGLYDRFLRDIFDYPHEKSINRLNIE